jgi:hypothetical protein
MIALSLAIAITPEKVWNPLSSEEKCNLQNWLLSINNYTLADNNWLFFKVLVNLSLKKVGGTHSREAMNMALNRLDEFYLSDGVTEQRVYYIAFVMHYYALIYSSSWKRKIPSVLRYTGKGRICLLGILYTGSLMTDTLFHMVEVLPIDSPNVPFGVLWFMLELKLFHLEL